MPTESKLVELCVLAHETAATPDDYRRFLQQYAEAVHADAAFVQRHYFSERRSEHLAAFGITRQLHESYHRYYSRINVWRQQGVHLYGEGNSFIDEQVCLRETLRQTEFYNDCLRAHDLTRAMTGVVARRGDQAFVLTAMRRESRQRFDKTETKVLRLLLPHLASAYAGQERLQVLEAGEWVLNALPVGIVLVASDQHVVFVNGAAETTFREADGLALREGRIATTDRNAAGPLQRLLAHAMAPGQSLECPPVVLVARTSGRRPYYVTAAPLRRQPKPFVGVSPAVAVVWISDPDRQRVAAIDTLRTTYKLTRREAMLAMMLADGQVLADVAAQLGMTYETARTHLRRILSKTETSRQAQLVLLVERLVNAASMRRVLGS